MKAIVYRTYGSPDVLSLEEVETPKPQTGEVLIRVEAVMATPSDVAMRSGDPFAARIFTGLTGPKKSILGTELAGEIVGLGEGVTNFAVGDEVWAATGTVFGGYAEYLCLPADGAVAKRPASLSAAEAAAICESGLTSLPFLRESGKIQADHRVLINGAAGGLGVTAVQIAKHFGAEVTGVCGPDNVDLVKSLGADHVVDYTAEDFTARGETYDIIFDAVGKSTYGVCKKALAEGGIYLTTVPSLGIFVHMLTTRLSSKKAAIAFAGLRPDDKKVEDLEFLRGLVERGALKPVIGRTFAMDEIVEAHRYVESGHKRGGAIVDIAASA